MIFGFTSHVLWQTTMVNVNGTLKSLPFFEINFVLLTIYLWHEMNGFAFMCRILLDSTKWLSLRPMTLSFT